jgi:hypothetical protein
MKRRRLDAFGGGGDDIGDADWESHTGVATLVAAPALTAALTAALGPTRGAACFAALDKLPCARAHVYPHARLDTIFSTTRGWWREYVSTRLVQPVRLLLVAEAPPWRGPDEPVSYIFKPDDDEYAGGLLGPIVQAVASHLGETPPAFVKRDGASKSGVLTWLGARGVLLVDPLPFALSYTKLAGQHSSLRASRSYAHLCAEGWNLALHDLETEHIKIHDHVAIAFSLRTAARAVLSAHEGVRLPLPGGRAVAVAEETHCFASSAGYPNAALLEQILTRMPMPSCAGVDGGEVCTHEEGGRGSRRLTSNPA